MNHLKKELANCNWNGIFTISYVNRAYGYFIRKIRSIYDKYFPASKVCINLKQDCKSWITKGSLNVIKKKNNLYIRFLKIDRLSF